MRWHLRGLVFFSIATLTILARTLEREALYIPSEEVTISIAPEYSTRNNDVEHIHDVGERNLPKINVRLYGCQYVVKMVLDDGDFRSQYGKCTNTMMNKLMHMALKRREIIRKHKC